MLSDPRDRAQRMNRILDILLRLPPCSRAVLLRVRTGNYYHVATM